MKISFNKKLATDQVAIQTAVFANGEMDHTVVAPGALVNAALELAAKHGFDPGTKPQAAAHEAGHIIVAHAMGWIVKGAELLKRTDFGQVRWSGFTHHTMPGYEKPKYGLVTDDPMGALQIAVVTLAGFFGEVMVGLDHPTSSLDERYQAMNIAAGLNMARGKPEGYTQSKLGSICWDVINHNRQQFDVVRAHLNRSGKLNRGDAMKMLADVRRFDLNTMFGGRAPCPQQSIEEWQVHRIEQSGKAIVGEPS